MRNVIAICRWSLLCIIVFLAACGERPEVSVKLPETDHRDVRYLSLENGLDVLLISDPSADKSAAALDVNIGSRQDPADRPGLAHFLEHMLFLGTKKYPDPGEYQAFIASHGGQHNAYTAFEDTNYFFDVSSEYLDEALDRFAQFFVSPLFNAEFVGREVNAVDSEYQARIKDDLRRGLDVFKEQLNPEHPFSRFSVGSLSTLMGGRGEQALRQDLLQFYSSYYSANRMKLVVVGREDLDKLQAMVVGRFSAIPNHNVKIGKISEPLLLKAPLLYELKPTKDVRELSVSFPVPDMRAKYHAKPYNYIGNLLGHEGEGSLLYLLKQRGWAQSLSAGSGMEYQGGALFSVNIELTPAGLEAVDAVVDMLFEYIALIDKKGIQNWRYQELSDIARQQFAYRTRPEEVQEASHLASNLQYYSANDVIYGDYDMSDYDSDLIASLLNEMRLDNAVISLVRPGVEGDRVSQLYDVPYRVLAVTDAQRKLWGTDSGVAEMHLPEANRFIAENLSLKTPGEGDKPKQVLGSQRLGAWYLNDAQFRVPKGSLDVLVRAPGVSRDAAGQAASEIWVRMVRDELNAYTYPAQLAGLNYSLNAQWDGIALELQGFDDKQSELLEAVASHLGSPDWDSARFDRIKAEYLRDLVNNKHLEPYRYMGQELSYILNRFRWSPEERLAAADALTLDQLKDYVRSVMASTQLYIQAYGNYSAEDVKELATTASNYLLGEKIPDEQPAQIRRIPEGQYAESFALGHPDAGLLWYLQAPEPGHGPRITMGIAGQMLGPQFFHKLRTEAQLGYIVSAGAYPVREVPGLYFLVQSPVADTAELQKRFTGFLQDWLENDTTKEAFEQNKQALRAKLTQSPRNLWEASELDWRDLLEGYTHFDSRERLVAVLDRTDYETWKSDLMAILKNRRSLWLQSGGRWGEQNLKALPMSGPAVKGQAQQYFLYEHPSTAG